MTVTTTLVVHGLFILNPGGDINHHHPNTPLSVVVG